jgi:hypothetical protein
VFSARGVIRRRVSEEEDLPRQDAANRLREEFANRGGMVGTRHARPCNQLRGVIRPAMSCVNWRSLRRTLGGGIFAPAAPEPAGRLEVQPGARAGGSIVPIDFPHSASAKQPSYLRRYDSAIMAQISRCSLSASAASRRTFAFILRNQEPNETTAEL